jgi:hypothetical protein
MSFSVLATPLAPIPGRLYIGTHEVFQIKLDMTPLLNSLTVSSAVSSLTNVSVGTGQVIGGFPSPTVSSPYVNQVLSGSLLTADDTFEVQWDVTMSDATTIWTQVLTLVVPR